MKPILEIQNISKKFRINHEQQPYLSLRDSLTSIFRDKSSKEDFWALKDVSFNVMPGDTVGIIGKNGAGKSTLLKILSKITPPTSGKIIGRGRIASLLEVGTGFHPELSGRENIFMNGSILGMRHAEIQRNFDAIVDFAGVEKFIDTPLKHYSSGMQLRLAFAVAAFLENEILIIDEVLAVGDAEFQKKCMGKMDDVSKSGRTILFVSHDLNSLSNICKTGVLLNKGNVVQNGQLNQVISKYLHGNVLHNSWSAQENNIAPIFFKSINIELEGEQPELKLKVRFVLECTKSCKRSFVAFNITNQMGQAIGQAIPNTTPFIEILKGTSKEFVCEIKLDGFVPDEYYISPWIGSYYSETYDWRKEIVSFKILNSPQKNRSYPHARECGAIVPFSKLINEHD